MLISCLFHSTKSLQLKTNSYDNILHKTSYKKDNFCINYCNSLEFTLQKINYWGAIHKSLCAKT